MLVRNEGRSFFQETQLSSGIAGFKFTFINDPIKQTICLLAERKIWSFCNIKIRSESSSWKYWKGNDLNNRFERGGDF